MLGHPELSSVIFQRLVFSFCANSKVMVKLCNLKVVEFGFLSSQAGTGQVSVSGICLVALHSLSRDGIVRNVVELK